MKRIITEKSTFDMINAFQSKINELEESKSVNSATWLDTDGFMGQPGEKYTDEDLRKYWDENYEYDYSLQEFNDFESWYNATVSNMTASDDDVESCNKVFGAQYLDFDDTDNVYMLMSYLGGEDGMESDEFSCLCMFKADSLDDAKSQVADWDNLQLESDNQYYADYFNDYFVEDTDGKVYNSISDWEASNKSSEVSTCTYAETEVCASEDQPYYLSNTDEWISEMEAEADRRAEEGEDYAWEELATKQVEDADGFMTDYTLYKCNYDDTYVCVFGDNYFYRPEQGEFDWEGESEEEAWEWFNSYNGFAEDVEMSTELEGEPITGSANYDIAYWLEEHDEAYTDATNFFDTYDLTSVDPDKLIAWISDHPQLYSDFCMKFPQYA